jgi:hypothetical protein
MDPRPGKEINDNDNDNDNESPEGMGCFSWLLLSFLLFLVGLCRHTHRVTDMHTF